MDNSHSNSTAREELQSRSLLSRLAWLLVPLLALMIAGLWIADLRGAYESPFLLLVLNIVCSTLASFFVAYLVARSFLVRRTPGLLLLGCGIIAWGAAGVVAVTIGILGAAGGQLDINLLITIHNLCVWLSGLCHLAGAACLLRCKRELRAAGLWLTAAYMLTLGAVGLVTLSALAHWTPMFFVQGQGGTVVRLLVLGSAIAMFVLSVAVLGTLNRRSLSPFVYWYTLALALIAVGLFGIMVESVHASLLSWTGRAAQFLSGVYMLIAALAAMRETGAWKLSLTPVEEDWRENAFLAGFRRQTRLAWLLRYCLAVGAVAAAMGLRLGLTAWVGPGLPAYITFYPAVMLVALAAGFGPGLVATALAGFAADYWVLSPAGQLGIASPVDRLGLVIFASMGAFMSAGFEYYRRYRHKAAAYDRAAALRESQTRLAAFADATFEGIVESAGGRIVDCNEQFARMAGFSVAELSGLEVASLIAPEDRDRVMANVQQGRESVNEHTMLRRDGTRIVVEAHGRPIAPGSPRRHTAVRDITERKRAEEAMRESEVHYRNLFNSIDAGFCVIEMIFDAQGKPSNYRFLEVNSAFEKQTGLHDAQGKLMRDLAPAHEGHWFETYGRIAVTGEAAHFVNEARALNRWYDVYAYRIGAPEDRQVAILFNDITTHKQAETEIRQRVEELRAANEELTRFNRVTVGRELRIIELKKQVNALCARVGQPPRYEAELDEQARPTQ